MRILILFALLLLSSCGPTVLTNDLMPPEFNNAGFKITKPDDDHWYVLSHENTRSEIIFRAGTASETHSIFARCSLRPIPREPVSQVDFERMVKSWITSINDRQRFELISYLSEECAINPPWCISYSSMAIDHAPGNGEQPLVLTRNGYMVLHPTLEYRVVHAEYSERGLGYEVNNEAASSARELIKLVEIKHTPKPIRW